MTDDSLQGVEFSSGSETQTAGEFIDTVHDPDILYYYIQDAYEKADSGIKIETDGKEDKVQAHAQVEIFQSAIQYVEAFGIYLLSYIKEGGNLVDNLVQIEPKHLRRFFEKLRDDQIDEYFENQGIEKGYRETLEHLFGYAFVDSTEDEAVSEEDIKQAIEQSIDVLDSNIRRIAEFYLYFNDIYNAVKHGNRALPQVDGGYTFSPSDGEDIELDLDLDFVFFLCRNKQAEPYTVSVPVEYLIKHSMQITDKVHRVFNYLKQVSNAKISEEPVDLSFFEFTETDSDPEPEWITATHQSGVIILPKIEVFEELQQTTEWTFPARVEVDHRTLRIRTQFDEKRSKEYPVLITIQQKGLLGLTPQSILGLDFDHDIGNSDVVQHFEFLKLQKVELEEDGIDEIKIINENTDELLDTGEPEDLSIEPAEEQLLTWEKLEQLYWLQKISGERIPVPFNVSQKQNDVIERCIESNVTEKVAEEAVEEIRKIGEDIDWTVVYVEKVLPTGQKVSSEFVGEIPGEVSFQDVEFADEDAKKEFENTLDNGGKWRIPMSGFDSDADSLIELLNKDFSKIEKILNQLDLHKEESMMPDILIESESGESGFWETEHILRLQFLIQEWSIDLQQQCPLCGSQISEDLGTHINESCDASVDV